MGYISYPLKQELVVDRLITMYYLELSKNFVSGGEKHDFWELVYVDKGEIEVATDGRPHLLRQGSLIMYRPGEFHIGHTNRGLAPNLLIVSFECDSPAMQFFWDCQTFLAGTAEQSHLALLTREAYEAFGPNLLRGDGVLSSPPERPRFGSEQMCKIALEMLLIQLIRRGEEAQEASTAKETKDKSKPSSIQRETREESLLDEIMRYIAANLHQDLSVAHLAGVFSISRSHLGGLFRTYTGKGVLEYITAVKIAEAKAMIRRETCNISQIAEKLGYSSVHYFSRFFKLKTGTAPSEYARTVKARWERNEPERRPASSADRPSPPDMPDGYPASGKYE